MRSVLADL